MALSLGATRLQMLVRVLLPNLIPTALAAWLFAFIISFDEVSMSAFLVKPGLTTLPVRMFAYAEHYVTPVILAASVIMLALSAGAMFAFDRLLGIDRLMQSGAAAQSRGNSGR